MLRKYCRTNFDIEPEEEEPQRLSITNKFKNLFRISKIDNVIKEENEIEPEKNDNVISDDIELEDTSEILKRITLPDGVKSYRFKPKNWIANIFLSNEDDDTEEDEESNETQHTLLSEGGIFSCYNPGEDDKPLVFLRIDFEMNLLEVGNPTSINSFPFEVQERIDRKNIIGIEVGPTSDMFQGTIPESEEIILGMSILIKDREKQLNLLAPSKIVLLTWIEGLEKFMLE